MDKPCEGIQMLQLVVRRLPDRIIFPLGFVKVSILITYFIHISV